MSESPVKAMTPEPLERTLTGADDRVLLNDWLPPQVGVVPKIRIGRRWINVLWALPLGFVLAVIGVAVAQGLRELPAVQDFLVRYPGVPPSALTVNAGFPAWLRVQHFLNVLFMVFIIRAGVQVLADHPRLYWKRDCTPGTEWFRFQKAIPTGRIWTAKDDSVTIPGWLGIPGIRHSIGLARWWHFSFGLLWIINGIVVYALLFWTGQWQRLVPTTWDVFPNALSTALQYLSLTFPVDESWTRYNSLQQLAYFITVFVAAPVSILTGFMQGPAISNRLGWFGKSLEPPTGSVDPLPRDVVVPAFHLGPRDPSVHYRSAGQSEHDVCRGARRFLDRVCDFHPGNGAGGCDLVAGLAIHHPARAFRSGGRRDYDVAVQRPDRMVGPKLPTDGKGHLTIFLAKRHHAEVGRVRRVGSRGL